MTRSRKKSSPEKFRIGGTLIRRGTRTVVNVPVPDMYNHAGLNMPVVVIRGKTEGPRLFVSAAVHGDEINGIEIIRRLLESRLLTQLKGILIAVPVVNVYGLNHHSRYLPDRRDLNRSFPGSAKGSFASRLAHIFIEEVASHATHGIDLHTAAIHRNNLPHIRADMKDSEIRRMAENFPVPVILNKTLTDGSMREALRAMNIPVIVYEGGEALRFDEAAIQTGLQGVCAVMRELGMLPKTGSHRTNLQPAVVTSSHWVRAACSGIIRSIVAAGAIVKKDQNLGCIADTQGNALATITAEATGIIIGSTTIPLVHEGEALLHIAKLKDPQTALDRLDHFYQHLKMTEKK